MPPNDEPGRHDQPEPFAEPLFKAARTHLRGLRSAGFLLYDQASGCYVAANPDIEDLAKAVNEQLEWRRGSGRPPDVMADTGEIVTDFKPLYPPDG